MEYHGNYDEHIPNVRMVLPFRYQSYHTTEQGISAVSQDLFPIQITVQGITQTRRGFSIGTQSQREKSK